MVEPLADPGDGSLWLARDRLLDEAVAVRVLATTGWPEGILRARNIRHPSIAPVRDVGSLPEGHPFLVTPCPTARSFGAPAETVPPREWTRLVAQLLEAVALIHQLGWVHGQLRPAHLSLDHEDGRRLVLHHHGAMVAPHRVGEPRTGYASPERRAGRPASVADDLFAVGVLAFTACTGLLPACAAPERGGLAQDESLEPLPDLSAPAAAWLDSLLRRDPAARPSSADLALTGLEDAAQRELRRAGATVAGLSSVAPPGRRELAARLADLAGAGGLGIVLGEASSGRSAILRAAHHALRARGRPARLLSFGSDPVASHRALRLELQEAVGFDRAPPHGGQPAAETAAGLRSYEASLVSACRAMLATDGPWLVDDVDVRTLAGRVLVGALELGGGTGVVLAADGAAQGTLERLIAHRGDSRDVPIALSPLSADQIARWLPQGLGPIERPVELATLLRAETDGLPGLVRNQVRLLVDRGALTPEDTAWGWSEVQVLPLLGGVTQPMRHGPQLPSSPDEFAARALDAADRAAAAADPRAALDGLARDLQHRVLHGAAGALLAPIWERLAHLCMVVDRPAEASGWFARLREGAPSPSPAERARLIVEEARALRSAGRAEAALDLLVACWDQIIGSDDVELERDGWTTRCACLLRLGDLPAATEAVASLEEATRDAGPTWTSRAAGLRATLELQLGRPGVAADVCARELAKTRDGEPFLRATLMSTQATAWRALGRLPEALDGFAEARALLVADGRLLEAARVSNNRAMARHDAADWAGALEDWESFRSLARRAGDPWELACALNNLGSLYRDTGQLDRAAETLEEALRVTRRHRLGRLEPLAMSNLAEAWARMGDLALAVDAQSEALALAERSSWWAEAEEAARRLACLRMDAGELAKASLLLDRARTAATQLEAGREILQLDALSALLGLRGHEALEGDETRALDAIRSLQAQGAPVLAARLRIRLADALLNAGRYGPAETLLDEAEETLRPIEARPDLARVTDIRRALSAATRNTLLTLSRHHDWLQELTLALSRERDLDRLVDLVLDRALELVGEQRGLVRLFDERGVPSLQVSRRITSSDSGTFRVVDAEPGEGDGRPVSTSVIDKVVQTRAPVLIRDVYLDPELSATASIRTAGTRAVLCVPILRAEQLLGVIYVDGPTAMLDGATGVKAELLTACADAASVAIENARLIEALRRKQDALAIMAHELRTPITSIIGFASLLLSPDEDRAEGEEAEMLGLIKSEAERVRAMVGRVLELARMQAGAVEWRRDPVDSLALVVAGVDSLRPLARQAEVRMSARAAEDLPDVLGDEERLIQVMVNLVGNALKFAPRGGHVEVAARRDGSGVRITVEDDGPGVPAERIDRIFEPWQQAGSARMRRRGVGLGLAIAQAIVQRHSGWITAENRIEGGARFIVWLPAVGVE